MDRIKLIPIYMLYGSTFFLAALAKWQAHGVPDWFAKQFGSTPLNLFPGALSLQFHGIASLETLVCAGFAVSAYRREYLPGRTKRWLIGSLLLAELAFVVLGFGLRLTQDFNGAASLFFYFGATLLALQYVESSERVVAAQR